MAWKFNPFTGKLDYYESAPAETDPLSWSKASDQTLLTGDKSGSFDLSTTGKIGIGTLTPKSRLQIGSFGNIEGGTDGTVGTLFGSNVYNDGAYKGIVNGNAQFLQFSNSGVGFITNSGVLADTAFTPSVRLLITIGGKVLINSITDDNGGANLQVSGAMCIRYPTGTQAYTIDTTYPSINLVDMRGYGRGRLDFFTYGAGNPTQTVPTVRWEGIDTGAWGGQMIFWISPQGGANPILREVLTVNPNGIRVVGVEDGTYPVIGISLYGSENLEGSYLDRNRIFLGNTNSGISTSRSSEIVYYGYNVDPTYGGTFLEPKFTMGNDLYTDGTQTFYLYDTINTRFIWNVRTDGGMDVLSPMRIGTGAYFVSSGTDDAEYAQGCYYVAGWISTDSNMCKIAMYRGTVQINSASGTPGSGVSFNATSFMIHKNGNICVNSATDRGCKFDVNGTVRTIGASTPSSGAGIEFYYSSGGGSILAYDRTNNVYKDIYWAGANAYFQTVTFGASTGDMILNSSGNITLGVNSTKTITHLGRMIVRTTASDPQHATAGSRPAGTVAEIAYYSGKMYFCTNASTPTWEKITSG